LIFKILTAQKRCKKPCNVYFSAVKSIGILADTHGWLDERIFFHFKDCDEIWHAGDFGSGVAEAIERFKPLRGVYGNIDGQKIRAQFPIDNRFLCEGIDVWMRHIGGYPGNYDQHIKSLIEKKPPQLFISGHSHILKIMKYKKTPSLLHINPGAAGQSGFHKVRTIVRIKIDDKRIYDVEAIELGPRSSLSEKRQE
jgi:uncharacterized protein